jgi:peroxiredoxin
MNMKPQLLTPGEIAPDFELNDINGSPIRLSSFRRQNPVVLAFLRGFM